MATFGLLRVMMTSFYQPGMGIVFDNCYSTAAFFLCCKLLSNFVTFIYRYIFSSRYRIGPFEVESALLEHPAVAEAAVVGVPDEIRFQVLAK